MILIVLGLLIHIFKEQIIFASHQHLEHKLGVICTLRYRANTTGSNEEENIKENQHLKKVLSLSGYPMWSWEKPAATSKRTDFRSQRLVKDQMTLLYLACIILHGADIIVRMHPHMKFHHILVAPKDPIQKMDQSGIIYAVWRLWFQICRWDWSSSQKEDEWAPQDSSVGTQHAKDSGHKVNFDQVKVLDRESWWFHRGVKESIHIITNPQWPHLGQRLVHPPKSVPHTPPLWSSVFVSI